MAHILDVVIIMAKTLLDLAQDYIGARWRYYEYLAGMPAATGGLHD